MTLETPPLVVLSSVLLTEVHVVPVLIQPCDLESGTILMDQWCLIVVKVSTELEEAIKLYT